MSEHVEYLLDAYRDDELALRQRHVVEDHLSTCTACRAALAQRTKLTSLIQEVPTAAELKPTPAFAEELMLLIQEPAQSHPHGYEELFRGLADRRVLQAAWMAIPVALLLAFAFVQTVGILSTFLTLIPGSHPVLAQGFALVQPPVELQQAQPWSNLIVSRLGPNLGGWTLSTSLFASFMLGLLYLAWLAGWITSWQSNAKLNTRKELADVVLKGYES